MADFLLVSVSHRKTNAATSGAKRQISVGHMVGRFQLPSGAPSPRFANLEEQGLASGFLGTNRIPQKGTCSDGRWSLTFKSLWPVVTNTEAQGTKQDPRFHRRTTHTHPHSPSDWNNVDIPVHPTYTALKCVRKPEHMEKPHRDGETVKTLHRQWPGWESIFFLNSITKQHTHTFVFLES